MACLSDSSLVFVVCSDPKPDEIPIFFTCQSPVTSTDPYWPKVSNLFKTKGRVSEILLKELKFLRDASSDIGRELRVRFLEAFIEDVLHTTTVSVVLLHYGICLGDNSWLLFRQGDPGVRLLHLPQNVSPTSKPNIDFLILLKKKKRVARWKVGDSLGV